MRVGLRVGLARGREEFSFAAVCFAHFGAQLSLKRQLSMRSHSILPTPTPARSGALTPKPSANAAAPGKPAPHAVHKQAAERIRSTVQQNRARPNSLEAIRAKVKAEMKAEAAESKARTLEKLAVEEEEQRKVTEAEAA